MSIATVKGKGKGSGVWPSMVTHTRNLSSAFNPSKCTLTAVNTHLEQWAAILRRPGSSWGIGALLKGLTSVVVLPNIRHYCQTITNIRHLHRGQLVSVLLHWSRVWDTIQAGSWQEFAFVSDTLGHTSDLQQVSGAPHHNRQRQL